MERRSPRRRSERALTPALLTLSLAVLGTLSVPAALAGAQVRVERRNEFYSVDGTTLDELRASMRARGLRAGDRRVVGRTNARLSWRYAFRDQGGGLCRVVDASACRRNVSF